MIRGRNGLGSLARRSPVALSRSASRAHQVVGSSLSYVPAASAADAGYRGSVLSVMIVALPGLLQSK